MELSPDRREIERYLGYRNAAPDEEIEREIEGCIRELQGAVTPRFVYEKFPLSVKISTGGTEILCLGELEICSRDLMKNLRGCCAAYLMAVTLGPGPDRLIRRAGIGNMSRAVILQAAAAAMTETWCDCINERIRQEAEREGFYTRPRYSPGYGDLPLTLQKDISRILNMPKEIGVSLTETYLMTPSKSVTALIGVSKSPVKCGPKKGCAACEAVSCPYRASEN